MKIKVVSILLVIACLLSACSSVVKDAEETSLSTNQGKAVISEDAVRKLNKEYLDGLSGLDDPELLTYIEDSVYLDVIDRLDENCYVESIQTVYLSQEYVDELTYNSKSNVFFGFTLEELDKQFDGQKYVFAVDENNQTIVRPFEPYDDTYDKVIRNVAIGTGVILVCVVIAVATEGAGLAAVSAIFAASAKTAAIAGLSSGAIGAGAAGITTGVTTGDWEKAADKAALAGSEGFMVGAIGGAVTGGASEAISLHSATANGLTMNQVAQIQKESKYPLDIIKQFHTVEEYKVFGQQGLKTCMINGKMALIDTNIDPNFVDEKGLTNLQRMEKGLAPYASNGEKYNLHHIGQKNDGTLAVLTKDVHQKYDKILHPKKTSASEIDREVFDSVTRPDFWRDMAKLFQSGG